MIDSYRRKEERGAYILFLFFCIGWCLFSASSSSIIRLRGGDGEKDWSMVIGKFERWEQSELGLMAANWDVNNKLVERDRLS